MKSGCEICLLFTKGKHAHDIVKVKNVSGFLESPRLHHSKKPDEIRRRIDTLVGECDKIELFARERFQGWDGWGKDYK